MQLKLINNDGEESTNKVDWLTFSPQERLLSGIPSKENIGTYVIKI